MKCSPQCAFLCASLVFGLFSGCAPAPAPMAAPKDTRSEDLATLRATEDKLVRAIAIRDVDQILTFYTDDAWFFPPDAPMVKTAAERRTYWLNSQMSPGFTAVQGIDAKFEIAQSGELAVEYGRFFEVVSHKDGATTMQPQTHVITWRKQADGSWKVTAVMWHGGK